jgi:hypothetical protein
MSCCSKQPAVLVPGGDDTATNPITQAYGRIAQNAGSDQARMCLLLPSAKLSTSHTDQTHFCFLDANAVAAAFGYTADDLKAIPAEANLGLSCGNPTATANIKEV